MDYNKLLKTLCESEINEEEFEDLPLEDLGTEEIVDDADLDLELPEETEEVDSTIDVGSLVSVVDSGAFTAEELSLSDDEFEDFKSKVDAGELAVVFDVDDDDINKIDIVFEDGLEIFNLPRVALQSKTPKIVSDIEPTEEDLDNL